MIRFKTHLKTFPLVHKHNVGFLPENSVRPPGMNQFSQKTSTKIPGAIHEC